MQPKLQLRLITCTRTHSRIPKRPTHPPPLEYTIASAIQGPGQPFAQLEWASPLRVAALTAKGARAWLLQHIRERNRVDDDARAGRGAVDADLDPIHVEPVVERLDRVEVRARLLHAGLVEGA